MVKKLTTPKHNAKIGSNSLDAEKLRDAMQKLDNLEKEKADIASDIRDVYAELKNTGYDVPAIRSLRKIIDMDQDKRAEQQQFIELYASALEIDLDPFS